MKVLLAEDSRSNQMLIKNYVEQAGHDVIAVDNGQQAIDAFISQRPDLVILDVIMPVKDAIETAFEIRGLADTDDDWVPIVFLSAMTEADDIVKGIDAGGDDYLLKPVDPKVLNAKLRAMKRIANMKKQLSLVNHQLKMMTVKDGLTSIFNRRHFDEVLLKELKRSARTNTAISLVLADIDCFKPYNDNYGHQAGDDCLKIIALEMSKVIKRPGDLCARYGGEEFGYILPETTVEDALHLAETVRKRIQQLAIKHEYSTVANCVTLSCGVTTLRPQMHDNIEQLARSIVERADQGLYLAKEQGRNQSVIKAS